MDKTWRERTPTLKIGKSEQIIMLLFSLTFFNLRQFKPQYNKIPKSYCSQFKKTFPIKICSNINNLILLYLAATLHYSTPVPTRSTLVPASDTLFQPLIPCSSLKIHCSTLRYLVQTSDTLFHPQIHCSTLRYIVPPSILCFSLRYFVPGSDILF